ncbi:trypsin-like peptidase domain-containing protein [Streptomyces sp. NPDC001076]
MDEGIPTSPATPGDAVPATGERAKEATPTPPSRPAGDTTADTADTAHAADGDVAPASSAEAPSGTVQEGSEAGAHSEPRPPVADVGRPQQPRPAPDASSTPLCGRPGPWAAAPPAGHPVAAVLAAQEGRTGPAAFVPSLPPGDAAQRRRWRSRRTLVVGALVVSVLSGAVGGLIGASVERTGGLEAVQLPQPGPPPGPPPPGRPPGSVAGTAARALPSVVTLHVTATGTGTGTGEQVTGTGFVLDTAGHILTNNHVVEPAVAAGGRISVTFSSGAVARATVVGRDTGHDLAVVQVHGVHGLTPLPLGDSDDVRHGDRAAASDRN